MNLHCDVCRDLIPLVRVGVASKESEHLVKKHLESCEECRNYFKGESFDSLKSHIQILSDEEARELKVLAAIKKRLYQVGILILMIGFITGLLLTDSINLFYNALLMPALGIIAYILFQRKAVYFSFAIFLGEYIRAVIQGLSYVNFKEALVGSWIFAVIYAFLVLIGIIIAYLFTFSLSKGDEI